MGPREQLRRGLELEIPYYARPLPSTGRAASVLALFGFPAGDERRNLVDASLLLTVRTDHVETHKGQVALPGGHRDPEDESDTVAALRETEEEVGIERTAIDVVGQLPVLWTRTGFLVTPVLGILSSPIEETTLTISPGEIAEVFWAPVRALMAPETYSQEMIQVGDARFPIHSFQMGGHRVWGVTGSIIKNILDRISSLT